MFYGLKVKCSLQAHIMNIYSQGEGALLKVMEPWGNETELEEVLRMMGFEAY